ncbi:hypothetical protein KUTeg_024251 [Tegillarca granosa]|uniref:alpha-L-fucosidase n=1 Tax=Tegillarca granosa TaxID=220873 RepID=A0ABQ9E2G5_TEGGR|nr:hypothetical protein KUTeg_024251 [Tegillarca granosa]
MGMFTKIGRYFKPVKYILLLQVIFISLQFLAFYLRTVNAPGLKNINDGKYKPTWTSLETRPLPDWYNDGKIGIFLHWGVYSVPSFVDVGNEGLGEWFWFYWKGPLQNGIKHRKNKESALKFIAKNYPPEFQYTDFAPQFKAEFFEPDKWAKLFESSGARYVVLTSKHHEGFPLWPSRWAWNWNAMDNGPHRDLVGMYYEFKSWILFDRCLYHCLRYYFIGDLSKSVKKRGLKFGLYYSLYEWFNPLYLEDKRNGFRTQTYIEKKMMPEMRDMVLRYKPDLVWTDGDWDAPCSYWNCTQFLAWLYNDSPVRDTVVTNDRWGRDVRCKHDKESWGFRRNADVHDYFTMDELLEILAETVSKGGNLLMNIGPTADGRITPLFQERLLQLGSWLKVNGEAIYGTHQWITSKDPVTKGVCLGDYGTIAYDLERKHRY